MKKYLLNKKFRSLLPLIIFTIVALVGLCARSWHLSLPNSRVFDEVYFPEFASKLLSGELIFDTHPPLGKMLIAIGIALFGDNTLGWRVIPWFIGVLIPLLMFLVGKQFKPKYFPWIVAGIFAVEPIFVLYSRVGLMDGSLFFFAMAAVAAAYICKNDVALPWIVGLLIGLAVGIKWTTLAVVLPVTVILFQRKKATSLWLIIPIAFCVYILSVYFGFNMGHADPTAHSITEWHQQAYRYHAGLTEAHPWGSKWWSWPLMIRPLLMYYQVNGAGQYEIMTTLTNPILLWSSTLAVGASVLYMFGQWILHGLKKAVKHELLPLIVGYFAFWLPFADISRVMFMYHYIPAYGFALAILAYWLARGMQSKWWRVLVIIFIGIGLVLSIAYLPLAMAFPIGEWLFDHLFWFKLWL